MSKGRRSPAANGVQRPVQILGRGSLNGIETGLRQLRDEPLEAAVADDHLIRIKKPTTRDLSAPGLFGDD